MFASPCVGHLHCMDSISVFMKLKNHLLIVNVLFYDVFPQKRHPSTQIVLICARKFSTCSTCVLASLPFPFLC